MGLPMNPPDREPVWVPRAAVEAAHLDQVRIHGGQPGLRDEGLLESALERPRNRWRYETESDLGALAAAYAFGLIRNHPFLDGNKRTGFVSANIFLILNGHEIDAPEPQVVHVILQVADGTLGEEELAEWIRSVTRPLEP
jgi:death on curing protein